MAAIIERSSCQPITDRSAAPYCTVPFAFGSVAKDTRTDFVIGLSSFNSGFLPDFQLIRNVKMKNGSKKLLGMTQLQLYIIS
jgi:hypothetical protein